jgi:hypothetical protein
MIMGKIVFFDTLRCKIVNTLKSKDCCLQADGPVFHLGL